MKTLHEIEDDITSLKKTIFRNEIGHDMYYSSPDYHQNLLRLEALEHEADVLKGKSSPEIVCFDNEPATKKLLLQQMAEKNGQWFADSYRYYETGALHKALKKE